MKKTFLALVSLTAIALLSCSNDNPISSAEGVDYPQASTLSKAALPESYAAAVSSSQKLVSGKTMSVAAIPVNGLTYCSNEIDYYFGSPVAAATITKLEVGGGSVASNAGAFTMSYLSVRCGTVTTYATMTWAGATPISASTTSFNTDPAKTTCYLSFCGKCVGGYMVAGQMVNQCNKSYSNVNMVVSYQY